MSAPSWRDRHSACCEIKKGLFARPRCLRPLGATTIWLAVKYKKGLLARLRCLCPRGATAIRLATVTIYIYIYLVARPQSRALVGRDRCWLAPRPSLSRPAVSFS